MIIKIQGKTYDDNYGKLVNNELINAPYPLEINGYKVYGASEIQYNEFGFKNKITTPQPVKDGFYYTEGWIDNGLHLVQYWNEHELGIE